MRKQLSQHGLGKPPPYKVLPKRDTKEYTGDSCSLWGRPPAAWCSEPGTYPGAGLLEEGVSAPAQASSGYSPITGSKTQARTLVLLLADYPDQFQA